jgi:hypothetical protein
MSKLYKRICPRRKTAPPSRALKSGAITLRSGGMFRKILLSLETSITSMCDRSPATSAVVSSIHKCSDITGLISVSSLGLVSPMLWSKLKVQSHHLSWKTTTVQPFRVRAALQHLRWNIRRT